jgi:hypothetical protein
MPSSDRGKKPKRLPPKKKKPKEIKKASSIESFLEFLQIVYEDRVVGPIEKDKENLMKSLDDMKTIISQRYRKESEISKIINNLELEVMSMTTRLKSKAEEEISEVTTSYDARRARAAKYS